MKLVFFQLILETWCMNTTTDIPHRALWEERLGSSSYSIRSQAEQHLYYAWPYSDPLLKGLSQSKDFQVSDTAKRMRLRCITESLRSPPDCEWMFWKPMGGYTFNLWWYLLHKDVARKLSRGGLNWGTCAYRCISQVWGYDAMQLGVPPSVVRIWFRLGQNP